MCGIVTYFSRNSGVSKEFIELLKNHSLPKLQCRGPDQHTLDVIDCVILGHTRLSIIDLVTGTQPMYNEDSTVACTLNGEIYNYLELKNQLLNIGHVFKTKSDTEVIVHGYEEWGEHIFSHLNGMFGICIYDTKNKRLLVARDRVGEKPLVYINTSEYFACGSEIKALLPLLHQQCTLDYSALRCYMKYLYTPSPLTIFNGIRKLDPAHYLIITSHDIQKKRYWFPSVSIDWNICENEAIEQLLHVFSNSVSNKMLSDVPLGAFLSGGVDSSAVVALMAQKSSRPVKTFSVGFGDDISELPFAKLVAERFGTEHHELQVSFNVLEFIDDIIEYFDEPFADNSNIPTYLISKEARKHVKVILSGDGGDELLGGYEGYLQQQYYNDSKVVGKIHKGLDMATNHKLQTKLYKLFSRSNMGLHNWARKRSIFLDDELSQILKNDNAANSIRNIKWLDTCSNDSLSQSYCFDLNHYLTDDILKKTDMSSMMASIETRTPFLDHRMIELSLKLSPIMKIKNNQSKYLLKKAMRGYLPREILARPKQGFGVPLEKWLNTELREYVNDTLGSELSGVFRKSSVRSLLSSFYNTGDSNWRLPHKIWIIFVFELWIKKYRKYINMTT
jgi:asparagine synthase (glutamine-hydrolysing)